MLTQTVEYALRAVVYLADQYQDARTAEQIAEITHVPKAYLSKVMQNLVRDGVVNSQRGVNGGFVLAKPPAELTVLAVVNAVDPIRRIETCPLGLKSHGSQLCPLHRRLDNAIALVEEAFGGTTLAEILAEPSSSTPLCDFPSTPPIVELK